MPDILIDLPFPPSQNAIWKKNFRRRGGVYLSPKYKAWRQQAEALWLTQKNHLRGKTISGPFAAKIILDQPHKRGDLDNRVKVVLDFVQKMGIIVNDKHCLDIHVVYGSSADAPYGARLLLSDM